jgi:uncharacterized protein YbgA (DUF1722 family)/uncharacterized protein YbbK (DUF523 family)
VTFESCRWNGQIISSDRIESLKKYADFTTNCPEKEIGLGVPRDSLRLVHQAGEIHLMQPATGRDITDLMTAYAVERMPSYAHLDGFILKGKSPSCGTMNDTPVYDAIDSKGANQKGTGIFGNIVGQSYPLKPLTDEGRLINLRLWENFLTQIYLAASFREIKALGTIQALIQFHAENKLILMAFNQNTQRALGRIVANHEQIPISDVYAQYEPLFFRTIVTLPSFTSHINVLQHAMGYFKTQLSPDEKRFFMEELEAYRHGLLPLTVLIHLIRGWIVRFGEPYLEQQTYFQPFPPELVPKENFVSNREHRKRTG